MKALIMQKDRTIHVTEIRTPVPDAKEVIIKIAACGICGTDMHVYRGLDCTWTLPGVIGHEFAGTIVRCGSAVEAWKPGERVTVQPLVHCGECPACREGSTNLCSAVTLIGGEMPGGFAEFAAVPESALIRIPEGIPLEYGALSEPLATVIHGVNRLMKARYNKVVILGAGTIGLLMLSVLRDRAEHIFVTDVDANRLLTAEAIGAEAAIHAGEKEVVTAILNAAGGRADLVIDAAGFTATRKQGFSVIRPGGEMLCVALGERETEVDFMQLVTKELTLYGTQCHTREDFEQALDVMAAGRIPYEKIASRFPLQKGSAAFQNPKCAIKILLCPDMDTLS